MNARVSWLLCAAVVFSSSSSARAALVFNLTQSGTNVVVAASGSVNLAGLNNPTNGINGAAINSSTPNILLGAPGIANTTRYSGFTPPSISPFTAGTALGASSGSGDRIGISGTTLVVPFGYVSGSALSASSTFNNTTLSALGLNTGTFTWTWGSGANADSLTMNIGVTAVPEPSSMALLSIGAVGCVVRRLRRRQGKAVN